MQKRLFQLLILMLWFSLLSLSALAGGTRAEPNAPATATAEPGVWDKTREAGSNALESGQEFGSAAADKTHQIYQAVKEKGSDAGTVIADTSRSAWNKTRQAGAAVVEKAGELGHDIAEKSKSLYRSATKPGRNSEQQEI